MRNFNFKNEFDKNKLCAFKGDYVVSYDVSEGDENYIINPQSEKFWQEQNNNKNIFVNVSDVMNVAQKHITLDIFQSLEAQEIVDSSHQIKNMLKVFEEAGMSYQIHVAGGSLRDMVMRKDIKDYDFFITIKDKEYGILELKEKVLERYGQKLPNNPFIKFLKKDLIEIVKSNKRESINIYEQSILNFLVFKEDGKDVYEAMKEYVNTAELVNALKESFQTSTQSIINDDVFMPEEFKVSLLTLIITLVEDVSRLENSEIIKKSYLQTQFSNKSIIQQIGYFNLGDGDVGGVLKLNLQQSKEVDLIFLNSHESPINRFDWSICKIGALMYEYKANSHLNTCFTHYTHKKELEEIKKVEEKELEKFPKSWDSKFNVIFTESNNKSLVYKMDYSIEVPLLKDASELISRVYCTSDFLESLETNLLRYTMTCKPVRKLEDEIGRRKLKLLEKNPDFKIEYMIDPLLIKAMKDEENQVANKEITPMVELMKNLIDKAMMEDELRNNNALVTQKPKTTRKF